MYFEWKQVFIASIKKGSSKCVAPITSVERKGHLSGRHFEKRFQWQEHGTKKNNNCWSKPGDKQRFSTDGLLLIMRDCWVSCQTACGRCYISADFPVRRWNLQARFVPWQNSIGALPWQLLESHSARQLRVRISWLPVSKDLFKGRLCKCTGDGTINFVNNSQYIYMQVHAVAHMDTLHGIARTQVSASLIAINLFFTELQV